MNGTQQRIPPGPQEKFRRGDDFLAWMGRHFDTYGDTFSASVYGASAYVTRNVEFVRRTLVDNWHNYVKGQYISRVALLLGKGLMVSKGDLWKRQRRMIQPGFNHDSISTSIRLIASVNAKLLEKWQLAARQNEPVNVTHDVSGMALEVVLRFIFGDDYDRVRAYFDVLSSDPVRNMLFATSFRGLGKIIHEILEDRRSKGTTADDILDLLMEARDPDTGCPMPEAQLIDEVLTLIVAGHETTASTLNWCWYLISQHPEIEQKLWRELDALPDTIDALCYEDLAKFAYVKQILEETMRLYPAGWMVSRKALQDDQVGNYFVPAGTEIYVAIYFMQRHPGLWIEPDSFDPERFGPEQSRERDRLAAIPFSTGPRNCIGVHFARMEMQIHLMTIARKLHLRYDQSRPIELDAGVNLRSKFDFIMYPDEKDRALRKAG